MAKNQRICPICRRPVDELLWDYHQNQEEDLLEEIIGEYPAWKNSPDKVLWYYRQFVIPWDDREHGLEDA